MKSRVGFIAVVFALCMTTGFLAAQTAKTTVLAPDELKQAVPSAYFFRGKSATVQVRNSGGLRVGKDSLVLASLVDTSGYATDIAAKYQGLFITEVKVTVGGSALGPGEYGFGFNSDGKFRVLNVAADEVLATDFKTDDTLHRPVPLKMVEQGGEYRLYAGKKYVTIKVD